MELARGPTRWRMLLGIVLGALVFGIVFVVIAARLDAERYDARSEALALRVLRANVERLVNSDGGFASGTSASPSEVRDVEQVWKILSADESSPTCCPECGARLFINPDLGLWRTYPPPAGLAAVCSRTGRESHMGVDFADKTVILHTGELPQWGLPER